MAVALPPTPRSVQFPHNILHESPSDHRTSRRMEASHLSKPSLPSISSLMEVVKSHQPHSGMGTTPTSRDHQRKHSEASSGHATSPDRSTMINGSPRSHPPPTPPLPPTSSFDFYPRNSSGDTSPVSTTSQGGYYGHAPSNNGADGYSHLRSSYPPIPEPSQWPSQQQQQSPKQQPQHQSSHPPRSPTETTHHSETRQNSTSSYLEPPTPESYTGLSQQRPLPTTFHPVSGQSQSLPLIDPQVAPAASPIQTSPAVAVAWQQPQQQQQQQHHHYYPPSNPSDYPLPPAADRYVCPTCSKPFSRPSSLKIHTYSHTGEKPFKCKHYGCGKYFSVRSNMKRHEKGCHGGEGSSVGGNSPQA